MADTCGYCVALVAMVRLLWLMHVAIVAKVRLAGEKSYWAMDDVKAKMAAKNLLTAFLEEKRLRKTPERYAILDKVLEQSSHFDIMSLHGKMERDAYHVSRATIYNTMELLVECGLVRKHQFGNRHAQYEKVLDATNHHHLMCTECGSIKEVKDTELIKYMNSRKYPSFSTQYFALYVYGICNRCARRIKKATAEKDKK
ncbi:MAG: Fur family transcriptional regulator [Muribaculaceae bacterium]